METLQRTKEWHKERMGKITASNFAKVLTKGRAKDKEWGDTAMTYAMEICCEILTGEYKEFTSAATEWGIEYEPFAKTAYTTETFNIIKEVGFIKFDDSIGGSPDGLIGDNGMIEIKCPFNPVNHLERLLNNSVPDEYMAQIQGNLMICKRQWCDYVDYDYRFDKELLIIRVQRDEKYITQLMERLLKFKELILTILEQAKK
jgi:putative phage-type endonuclease